MHILVVDDVGYSRYRIAQFLTSEGHIVRKAASGPEALLVLREDPKIEVVVTDDGMPQMDGMQLYREAMRIDRLDDSGAKRSLPFILLAMPPSGPSQGGGQSRTPQLARDIGFAAVLMRPLCYRTLVSHLEVIEAAKQGNPQRSSDRLAAAEKPQPSGRGESPVESRSVVRQDSATVTCAAAGATTIERNRPEVQWNQERCREVALELRRFADVLDSMPHFDGEPLPRPAERLDATRSCV